MFFSQTSYNLENFKSGLKSKIYNVSKEKLMQNITKRSYGFIKCLYENDIKKIEEICKKLTKFKSILFLGTGGSSLGGKTLVSLKSNYYKQDLKQNIFFIENIDEDSIVGLLNQINLDKTAVVITSKSGETIETLSQYFFIKKKMKKIKNLNERFFVITENKKSTLKSIQEEEKFNYVEHKPDIGGRYSIFSVVGLIPAKLAGVDIKKFRDGGISFLENLLTKKIKYFDNYFLPSLSLIFLNENSFNISVMMPYIEKLQNFSLWYKQLWAESTGKKGKGITPINSLGTIDQHSQLQLFLDGPRDKFFTIIGKKKRFDSISLDCSFGKKKYKILDKKNLEKLMYAEMKATITTLKNKGNPLRFIELEKVDEITIGSLTMFFFLETIFCSYMLEVNPFDQPAVEQSKILTKKYLKNEEN